MSPLTLGTRDGKPPALRPKFPKTEARPLRWELPKSRRAKSPFPMCPHRRTPPRGDARSAWPWSTEPRHPGRAARPGTVPGEKAMFPEGSLASAACLWGMKGSLSQAPARGGQGQGHSHRLLPGPFWPWSLPLTYSQAQGPRPKLLPFPLSLARVPQPPTLSIRPPSRVSRGHELGPLSAGSDPDPRAGSLETGGAGGPGGVRRVCRRHGCRRAWRGQLPSWPAALRSYLALRADGGLPGAVPGGCPPTPRAPPRLALCCARPSWRAGPARGARSPARGRTAPL